MPGVIIKPVQHTALISQWKAYATLGGFAGSVFAIVTSYFLVGDSISWLQVAGLGLTLVGAWLVNRTPEAVGPQ